MRLHSSVSGLRVHLGVLKLGIIGGLSVLLMLAVAACNDAEPNPESTDGQGWTA